MKRAEETIVEVSADVFASKELTVEGCYETVVSFTYPGKCSTGMMVMLKRQNQEPVSKILDPGDTYTMAHKFKAKFTKDITKDHVFPITFKMDGQEYKLNRTKQNKLILTK